MDNEQNENAFLKMRKMYPAGSAYEPGTMRGKMWAMTSASLDPEPEPEPTDEMTAEETNSTEWEPITAIKFDQIDQVTQEPVEEEPLGESLRRLLERPVAPRDATSREHRWKAAEPSDGFSGGGGFGDGLPPM